jgi:hypothetical protein
MQGYAAYAAPQHRGAARALPTLTLYVEARLMAGLVGSRN